MPKFRVAHKDLEKVDGVAVKVGDTVELSGRTARRLEAAGHVVLAKGEVAPAVAAPAAVPARKAGARKAAKKSR